MKIDLKVIEGIISDLIKEYNDDIILQEIFNDLKNKFVYQKINLMEY